MAAIKSTQNVTYCCNFHVIWCPKYRRPVLVEGVKQRLIEILYLTAQEINATILELEINPDHLHLLVEIEPQFGIHRLVKQLKGQSSKLLRQEFPHLKSRLPSLWTNSYFVATVGVAPLEAIEQFIEEQRHV